MYRRWHQHWHTPDTSAPAAPLGAGGLAAEGHGPIYWKSGCRSISVMPRGGSSVVCVVAEDEVLRGVLAALLGLHCVLPYERAGGEVVSLVRVRVTVSDG